MSYWWYVAHKLQLVLWGRGRFSPALSQAAPSQDRAPWSNYPSKEPQMCTQPPKTSQQSRNLGVELVFESNTEIISLLMLAR